MQDNTSEKILREQVQRFYQALRDNDVQTLEDLKDNKFPFKWVQSFSETSLPEYAMKHGSVEGAWWLMANGQMPESWTSFTGSTWKSFLKKGLQMALSGQGPSISMDVYKEIVKVGIKTSGERLPSFLEDLRLFGTNKASSLLGHLSERVSQSIEKRLAQAQQAQEDNQDLNKNTTSKPRMS